MKAAFLILLCAGMACASGHGLRFDTPAQRWDEALPLGNGMLGALVWGDGQPLRISVDRADLWDLRPVPEFHSEEYNFEQVRRWHEQGRHADAVRLLEDPYRRPAPTRLPAGRIEISVPAPASFERTELDVETATARMHFTGGGRFEAIVHATEAVGIARWKGPAGAAVRLVAPPFGQAPEKFVSQDMSSGPLSGLGYPAPVETAGDGWRAYTQEGWGGFRFAVYTAWRGSAAGEWLLTWSVASSREGSDPLRLARERARRALEAGYEKMFAGHREWWQGYWSRASVRLPNPVLERLWYLEQYKFGSASRRGAPPITLQAVWTADNGQIPPWKGDYHHDLNTEMSYWPCYAGNRLEEGLAFLDWLWETRAAAFDWTRRFFRLPGLNVPMTADLDGRQMGGWRQYTHSATTAAWLAQHFYLHWKYSGDRVFLRERAYPYLHDAAVFLEAYSAPRDAHGRRTFPLSSSPEIHDNRPEAWFSIPTNYDLALSRWLMGAAAELAGELGLAGDARRWKQVLAELPELVLGEDGRLLVARDHPLPESHRHFSHLMAIHPLGLIDWSDGPEARRTISASLAELERLGTSLWTGYSFSWLANLAARARDGSRAERALEIFAEAFTSRNSFHVNGDQSGKGYSRFRYRPFTLEGNFAAASAIQEMLLQTQRDLIVIFPAVPPGWKNAAFTTLRAQGGFLVSAERKNGATARVEIVAERGGKCRILSPFSGKEMAVEMKPGERRVLAP